MDMALNIFSQTLHGGSEIELQGSVMLVSASGTWNEPTASSVARQVRSIVTEHISGPWAIVMEINHWELTTPEAGSIFLENSKWCRSNGLIHSAIVAARSSLFKTSVLSSMLAPLENPRHDRQVFQQKYQAIEWLADEGHDTGDFMPTAPSTNIVNQLQT